MIFEYNVSSLMHKQISIMVEVTFTDNRGLLLSKPPFIRTQLLPKNSKFGQMFIYSFSTLLRTCRAGGLA